MLTKLLCLLNYHGWAHIEAKNGHNLYNCRFCSAKKTEKLANFNINGLNNSKYDNDQ